MYDFTCSTCCHFRRLMTKPFAGTCHKRTPAKTEAPIETGESEDRDEFEAAVDRHAMQRWPTVLFDDSCGRHELVCGHPDCFRPVLSWTEGDLSRGLVACGYHSKQDVELALYRRQREAVT